MRTEAVLLVALGTMSASCCRDTIEQEERSPSGDKIATVTYRNCGVFADGTSVTLRDAKSGRWPRSNLVVSAEGRHSFIALWKDDHTLKVFVPKTAAVGGFANAQIVHRNEDVNGTRIEYW